MDAPIGALAAGFADAGAIHQTQHGRAGADWRRAPSPPAAALPEPPGRPPPVSTGNARRDSRVPRSPATTSSQRFGATKTGPGREPAQAATDSRLRPVFARAGSLWSPAQAHQGRDRPEADSTGRRIGPLGQMPCLASVPRIRPSRAGSNLILTPTGLGLASPRATIPA